jgi:exosortase D (VPLPA-CTERM-specific)
MSVLRTALRWGLLLLAIGALYYEILYKLALHWNADPNFSHGWLVPVFSGYVVWQIWHRLNAAPAAPSWWGLPVTLFSLGLLILGVFGAELFLSRTSLLFLLAGLVIFFGGWRQFRMLFFAWAFLFLMVPIPQIVFNQIAFPLQLLASKLATAMLQGVGVPVLREGNVIQLSNMALEVVEACSGIRSLMSLGTLAIIYGYFLEKNLWHRVWLALGAIPIAVLANASRITGTGLLAHYWSPEAAEGFFHTFSGWLIFVVSLALLFGLHGLLVLLGKRFPGRGAAAEPEPAAAAPILNGRSLLAATPGVVRLVLSLALIFAAGATIYVARGEEKTPPHLPVAEFPRQVGAWNSSQDFPLDDETRKILGDGDFLLRLYRSPEKPAVDFFLAYFPTQRTGSTIHSPQNCIPGAGWSPIEATRIQIARQANDRVTVNRYIIAKGMDRQLVLYWYQSNGRIIASEYWAKIYLVWDSIRLQRSDGALVRIITPIRRGEELASAEQRAVSFAQDALQQLDPFVPR